MNPPDSITSEEASRPTGAEEGLRLLAASATDGVASPVGICEIEEIASPQDGQNRAVSGASVEQVGQRIKPESYRKGTRILLERNSCAAAWLNGAGTTPAPAPTNKDYFFSAGVALVGAFVDLPSMATFHF